MTKGTLIRTAFNWGWLTGSEVQSIIIKVRIWQNPGRHGSFGAESSTSSSDSCLEMNSFQAVRKRALQSVPTKDKMCF